MVKSVTGVMTCTLNVPRVPLPSCAATVIVAVPALTPVMVAVPSALAATVAIELLEELHVKFCAT